jgi:drug/metabolite transporter (DMT)-like permease
MLKAELSHPVYACALAGCFQRDNLMMISLKMYHGVVIDLFFFQVGDAMALIFTSPLFTIIFAAIFLKHSLSIIKVSAGKIFEIGQPKMTLGQKVSIRVS